MLSSNLNRGFTLTFENNLTISVQFGTGNYCERREFYKGYADDLKEHHTKSLNAEIAIWDETIASKGSDYWYDFGHDKVKGWCSADEVAEWIHAVQTATSLETIVAPKERVG